MIDAKLLWIAVMVICAVITANPMLCEKWRVRFCFFYLLIIILFTLI